MCWSLCSLLFSRSTSSLSACAPPRQPFVWLVVNLLCAAASSAVLLDTVLAELHSSWVPLASGVYFVWSLATTLIWCIEIGSTIAERQSNCLSLTWAIKIELCLAIVFLFDSLNDITAWHIAKGDLNSNLFDATLSGAGYFYAFWECRQWHIQQTLALVGLDLEAAQGGYGALDGVENFSAPISLYVPLATASDAWWIGKSMIFFQFLQIEAVLFIERIEWHISTGIRSLGDHRLQPSFVLVERKVVHFVIVPRLLALSSYLATTAALWLFPCQLFSRNICLSKYDNNSIMPLGKRTMEDLFLGFSVSSAKLYHGGWSYQHLQLIRQGSRLFL